MTRYLSLRSPMDYKMEVFFSLYKKDPKAMSDVLYQATEYMNAVDTVFCPPSICMPGPKKSKNIIFSLRGHVLRTSRTTWRNLFGHWSTRSAFSLKWPKWPWLPLGLTKGQMWSELSRNNIFHSFTSNLSFLDIFDNFDQVWPEVDPRWAKIP